MAYEDQYQAVAPKYDTLLFDVDDTLYSFSSGLSEQCTNNIQEYMIQKLGIEEHEVSQMNQVLYKNYGTSMAGLKAAGYVFDNDDYHSFVHGRLPYERLKPDHVLRSILLSLPLRKVIFSNADRIHVAKILSRLGLEGCFDGIICFESLNPNHKNDSQVHDLVPTNYASKYNQLVDNIANSSLPLLKTPTLCKPFEGAFQQAFKLANIDPQKTIFFDDSIRNIQTGKQMGLKTVLVGTSERKNGADYALESIHNIKEALPELWEAKDRRNNYRAKVSIETTVTA